MIRVWRFSWRVGGVVALVAVATAAAPRPARANDAALAEELYELGRKLMAEGHVAQACPRFAESERLDPATGTLLNLAACHEAEGKLATAWAEFTAAETAARHDGRDDRVTFARDHLAGIEPRLSYLRVVVDPASQVEALEVKLDQSALGVASWGVDAPIDPGEHEVTARAPGRAAFSERVLVTKTPRRLTVKVALPPEGAPAAAVSAGAGTSTATVSAEAPAAAVSAAAPAAAISAESITSGAATPPSAPVGSNGRIVGRVALGIGAAAVVVGAVFGLRAQSKWDARNSAADQCTDDACNEQGLKDGQQAQTAASVADVAFAVGVVGLGTAAYLLWLRHEPAAAPPLAVSPAVSPNGGGLALTGSW